ncbi:MAG: hypothetical protein LBT62_02410 [Deltaproteobacteria bacterium]|jgi:hypothetical protein|nr:hypothetical protein [Deltaproteobacteria bacterium]
MPKIGLYLSNGKTIGGYGDESPGANPTAGWSILTGKFHAGDFYARDFHTEDFMEGKWKQKSDSGKKEMEARKR